MKLSKIGIKEGKTLAEIEVGDWLDLDVAKIKSIEFPVSVVKTIRRIREESSESQVGLAERVGTSQPNIAKIEAGGIGVSLNLLMRVYFALSVVIEGPT